MDTPGTIKMRLHYYRFSIDKQAEAEAYAALREQLHGYGCTCFDSISTGHHSYYGNIIKPLDGELVEVETKHLFNNQMNTAPTSTSEKGIRVFDWSEAIYPNPDFKQGMWLEPSAELQALRDNTMACGYCGHQEPAQAGSVFHLGCLDSEYLKISDLHLLRMLAISDPGSRELLSEAEREHLHPQFVEAQTKGTSARGRARLARKRHEIHHKYKTTIENAKAQFDGYLWLMDHGVNIDNCIFYDHTGRFCFGWKKELSPEERSALEEVLCEFNFDYDLKGGRVLVGEESGT